jgi:hypothetical protein
MFVEHSNVFVSIYGTNVSRQGYHTWILFDRKKTNKQTNKQKKAKKLIKKCKKGKKVKKNNK